MDEQFIINVILITLLFFATAEYSIDMKRTYPFWIMRLFSEPYIRFLLYTLVYVLSCYNIQVSLLFGIIVVLLHIDYINLT
jgi:hypothetical protein